MCDSLKFKKHEAADTFFICDYIESQIFCPGVEPVSRLRKFIFLTLVMSERPGWVHSNFQSLKYVHFTPVHSLNSNYFIPLHVFNSPFLNNHIRNQQTEHKKINLKKFKFRFQSQRHLLPKLLTCIINRQDIWKPSFFFSLPFSLWRNSKML